MRSEVARAGSSVHKGKLKSVCWIEVDQQEADLQKLAVNRKFICELNKEYVLLKGVNTRDGERFSFRLHSSHNDVIPDWKGPKTERYCQYLCVQEKVKNRLRAGFFV